LHCQEWLESESSSGEEQENMDAEVEGAIAGASAVIAEPDDDDGGGGESLSGKC